MNKKRAESTVTK